MRTCQKLLKVAEALWTFREIVRIEPTNNAAERALRPAVWGYPGFVDRSIGVTP